MMVFPTLAELAEASIWASRNGDVLDGSQTD
jgi:hypothetical protein